MGVELFYLSEQPISLCFLQLIIDKKIITNLQALAKVIHFSFVDVENVSMRS